MLFEGEGWHVSMFAYYRATRSAYGPLSPLFFIAIHLLGNVGQLGLERRMSPGGSPGGSLSGLLGGSLSGAIGLVTEWGYWVGH